ncbi:3-(3-hydroxy-phenyl)propionate/3-hydroxycinnamic acid hydroxylase [Baekduia alba]|uniref:bifunctional 3-(3-hydroxy-phenyl)propionate/3-hydroxycinnamic acid hydroxylase n=1 Tax=Baekduia alba TaxID=2997333 RepID=UPI002340E999|nr:bifunctional 3-(3-hydroxy-phenyl)propionate/3-hydroxycinnamic acid hydroxylase [Baekduia alba]WCB91790.1 3-(3-hydroxy-phenyl)propionate/3-hydroxycinnamic acid hydroxylase [Baekduia alba]
MPDVDVLVVGGGPTGLAAANALGQLGVNVLLVEREPGVAELPRAVSVDDETMRFMQRLGLVDRMRDVALPGTGTKYFGRRGQLLAYARGPERPPHGQPIKNPIDHAEFQLVLLRGLRRYPHVDVRHQTTFTGFEQHADGVTATIETGGRTETVEARYLLGADGGRSPVRTLIGQEPMTGSAFEERWLVVDTINDRHDERYAMHYGDPDRPRVIVVGRDGRCRYEFLIRDDEHPTDDDLPDLVTRLVAPYRALAAEDVVRSTIYKFYALVADRFDDGRVFILGDAAHMMPPFAGQGLNSGIRDAANLSWKIAAELQGRAGRGLLDSYTRERQPHVEATVALSVRLGAVMMTRSRAKAWARDVLFATVGRVPAVKRFLTEMRYRPPALYPDGFSVDAGTDPLAGRMLIEAQVIDAAGHVVGLDAVLGTGFALLAVDTDPRCFEELSAAVWEQLGAKPVHVTLDHRLPVVRLRLEGVADLDGSLAAQLDPVRGRCVLVRPDKVVAGTFAPSEEAPFAAQLAELLGEVEAAAPAIRRSGATPGR